MNLSYHIHGMHCEACVKKIKSALSSHFKVIKVTLNPPLLQIAANKEPSLNELNAHILKAGKYKLEPITSVAQSHNEENKSGLLVYYPIFLIAGYIIMISFINNFHSQEINWQGWMNQFMASFFLVFSAFKFLDLPGFANGYATYDLLARRWHAYGYIYPFLELSLGILYLTQLFPTATQLATIIIMGFSSLGVINSLLKKQKFQCACLGTVLKVPLSSITLIEDLTMVILAGVALIMR
jgi:cation transport ATPase